ncbi:MAG: DUF805 domain-containing protein [Actinomycetes bacterium]|jgi:uncharacterized membrane protein YhaH (DUF805 family)
MVLVNAWKRVVLENYANFQGRANMPEFWWFVLANFIVYVVLGLILASVSSIFFYLFILYAIGIIIPNLAVAIRRLHDTGKSGWFILLGIIPCVGSIILLVFYATAGQPTDNQWGPPPAPGLPAA